MVHEDVVNCEDCGAEITHIVCGSNVGSDDPDYRVCDQCIANRDYAGQEPDHDDEVKYCPDCERPNQFGEMCASCERDRELA